MRDFFSGQGRTKVRAEAYILVRRRCEPAENAAQGKNSHLWMETSAYRFPALQQGEGGVEV
jgi:hypothetical protein